MNHKIVPGTCDCLTFKCQPCAGRGCSLARGWLKGAMAQVGIRGASFPWFGLGAASPAWPRNRSSALYGEVVYGTARRLSGVSGQCTAVRCTQLWGRQAGQAGRCTILYGRQAGLYVNAVNSACGLGQRRVDMSAVLVTW